MKKLAALSVAGLLILAGSASAQIVNGNEGGNTTSEAPIGTKAGGSEASKQAPGEAAAIKGARDNNFESKTGVAGSSVERNQARVEDEATSPPPMQGQ